MSLPLYRIPHKTKFEPLLPEPPVITPGTSREEAEWLEAEHKKELREAELSPETPDRIEGAEQARKTYEPHTVWAARFKEMTTRAASITQKRHAAGERTINMEPYAGYVKFDLPTQKPVPENETPREKKARQSMEKARIAAEAILSKIARPETQDMNALYIRLKNRLKKRQRDLEKKYLNKQPPDADGYTKEIEAVEISLQKQWIDAAQKQIDNDQKFMNEFIAARQRELDDECRDALADLRRTNDPEYAAKAKNILDESDAKKLELERIWRGAQEHSDVERRILAQGPFVIHQTLYQGAYENLEDFLTRERKEREKASSAKTT